MMFRGKHLHVGFLNADKTNGKSLELSTRKVVNVTVLNLSEFCCNH